MKLSILFILVIMLSQATKAQQLTSVPEVGTHAPLFTFEKNENPQNIMVVYTKLDSRCEIIQDPNNGNAPTFDFYWKMNRQAYKPVHSMIKSGIRERLQVAPASDHDKFMVQINDLKEVKTDIEDARLAVVSSKSPSGDCLVKSTITLGPSDKNVTIRLKSIYSEAEKTVLPPFRRLKSITLNGVNVKTGEAVSRTYTAK